MLERNIEKLLFACRWLLAPMYLGLSLALLALSVKFFQEVVHSLAGIFTLAESDLVLSVLSLIDIVLVGSLIVMVMLSGYENFVSKLDTDAAQDSPAWLGKLDSGTLKLKVAASIVAISSIPAAYLHERAGHAERQDPLVCGVTSDIRRVGRPARRARPDGVRFPPGALKRNFRGPARSRRLARSGSIGRGRTGRRARRSSFCRRWRTALRLPWNRSNHLPASSNA